MGTIIEHIADARPHGPGAASALLLATIAARRCLREAHERATDIDLLLNTGLYRDRNLGEPALAAMIQEDIGANPEDPHPGKHGTFSFDVANGTNGVLTAVRILDGFMNSGAVQRGIIVASDSDPGHGMTKDFPYAQVGAAMLCRSVPGPAGFGRFYWYSAPDEGKALRATVGQTHGFNQLRIDVDHAIDDVLAEAAANAARECLAGENLTPESLSLIVVAPASQHFRAQFAWHLGVPFDVVRAAADPTIHTPSMMFGLVSTIGHLLPGANALLVSAGAGVGAIAVVYRQLPAHHSTQAHGD